MRTIDDVVAEILHDNEGQVYDAAKRREYYLRTRELKGRRRGVVSPTSPPRARGSNLSKPMKKPVPKAKLTVQRIAELKARLEKLRVLLKQLGEQAKKRSGVDPKSSKASGSSGKRSSGSSTTTEKAAAKEYYEKHKNDKKTPSQEEKSLQEKIARVRKQIEEIKEKLAEAREQASKRQTDSTR